MPENPLKIIASDAAKSTPKPPSARSARAEQQARLERLWLTAPAQFNPMRNSIERERIARTSSVLDALHLKKGAAVDLGCGYGYISRHMHAAGWDVQAVDIASNALKAFAGKGSDGIKLLQDALPSTKLDDDAYELVVCTDVIAYLDQRDYRLLMAELSRLVKRDGIVVCSTAIDIDSEDALERFGAVAETEFLIEQWHFCHHLLLIRLTQFFEIPQHYVKAAKDSDCRRLELRKRTGFSRWWYKLNSSLVGGYMWQPIQWLFQLPVKLLRQNRSMMLFLESICRFFWSESGISHAMFVGKRRPLIMPTKADLESVEPKGKRQVWE